MPINFPNSPNLNEIYSYDNKTWEWNGIYWEVYSALTSYITSAYTAGDGVSDISGVTNGNLVLKSFSGVNITIIDNGNKLTFSGNSGNITGSGTTNYLPKWTGSTGLGNSLVYDTTTGVTIGNGFTWDNTNGRLGIGTSSPTTTVDVVKSYAGSLDNLIPQLRFQNSSVAANADLYALARVLVGTGYVGSYPEIWVQAYRSAANVGTTSIRVVSNHPLTFLTSDSERARIFANGNFAIGTTTDSGFKLDVNGVARVSGDITLGGWIRTPQTGNLIVNVGNFALQLTSNNPQNSSGSLITTGDITRTDSGTKNIINVNNLVSSTSASFNILNGYAFTSNITQTQGTIRGLFIAPTLVTSTNFIAIETTVGNVVLNSVSGNTLIGTTADTGTYKLDVSVTVRLLSGGAYLTLNNATYSELGYSNNNYFRANGAAALINGPQIQFLRAGNEVGRFAGTTGNLLIGTTTDAGYKLDVNGSTRSTNFRLTDNTLIATQYTVGSTTLTVSNTGHNNAVGIKSTSAVGVHAISSLGVSNNNLLGASVYAAGGAQSGNISLGLLSNRALITSAATGMGMLSSAMLQVDSTTQGFLPPRMTNTQRTSISSPVAGLMVYCTDSPEGLFIYKSTGWVQII